MVSLAMRRSSPNSAWTDNATRNWNPLCYRDTPVLAYGKPERLVSGIVEARSFELVDCVNMLLYIVMFYHDSVSGLLLGIAAIDRSQPPPS